MQTQNEAAKRSPCRRDNLTSVSSSSSNPVSEPQPFGVAAHTQSIVELLAQLVKSTNRIADAIESQNRTVIQPLQPISVNCEDAGKYIGVGEKSVRNLIRAEKLPDFKLFDKKGQVILVEDLKKLVKGQRVATGEEINDPQNAID